MFKEKKANIDKSILLNVILIFINIQIVQFLFNLYDKKKINKLLKNWQFNSIIN